jgi:hypothetical protein
MTCKAEAERSKVPSQPRLYIYIMRPWLKKQKERLTRWPCKAQEFTISIGFEFNPMSFIALLRGLGQLSLFLL